MFFAKIFRRFFFSLDSVLFNFIATLYDLLMAISRTTILTQGEIAKFATRIEILLGVFMLFKVSFSLITYIVNPDDFSDKSKGFGKLIQNSVISLVLLVLVPYIFQMAFSLQAKVLEGNVLARLMLGEDLEQNGVEDNVLIDAGERMSFYVMLPFFKPNYSINGGEGADLSACINLYDKGDDGKNVFSESCKSALISVNKDQGNGMDDTDVENYANGINEQSLGLTFRINPAISTIGSDKDEQFVIDYMSPISTVVAVIVCLLLVTFCIDIGIRSVKLAFLQLIYPIPVISYMDPKGGKDGMFSKWYKMCFSTFISLFVRLLALYFGLYIISRIGSMGIYDVVNGSQITNGWVMIFVIIGVLMFIKQLPKILENMGIKLEGDGNFNLNPLKRVFDEKNGIAGAKAIKRTGIAAGAAGLAGAAAIGANALTGAQRFGNAKGLKGKIGALFGGAGSMIAGGMSGLTRGIRGGLKGEKFGKNFSNSYSSAMKNKQTRSDRKSDNVGWGEMMTSKFKQNVGMHTGGEKVKSANDVSKKIQSTYDSMMNAAKGNDTANFSANINGVARNFNGIKGLDKFVQELKKTSISRDNFNNEADYLNAVADHQKSIDDAEDAMKARLDSIASGTSNSQDSAINSAVRSGYKQMQDLAKDLNDITRTIDENISTISAGSSAKTIYGTSKGISNQIISSEEAVHQQTVDEYAKKKDQK